jgi:hypothetical protein
MSFEEAAMRVDVLVVPDCPNGPVVIERLAQALDGRGDVQVATRVIETVEQADQWGMHGSPTVLVDGRDPFATPGSTASVSCRLYQDEAGRAQGAPSLARLRQALDEQQERCARERQALRAALRQGLTTAMKARDTEALAALRTAIAAIDNAEAIATTDTRLPVTSADIAGASSGVGSTEAVRQSLSSGQLRDIVREQITEYTHEADRYDALGEPDAARRLRHRARILAAHLAPE